MGPWGPARRHFLDFPGTSPGLFVTSCMDGITDPIGFPKVPMTGGNLVRKTSRGGPFSKLYTILHLLLSSNKIQNITRNRFYMVLSYVFQPKSTRARLTWVKSSYLSNFHWIPIFHQTQTATFSSMASERTREDLEISRSG